MYTSLVRVAWLNVVLHLAGLVMAGLYLRPGSPLASVPERLEYLRTDALSWQLAWGVWMLCALAFVSFFTVLASRLSDPDGWVRLAVLFAAGGAAIDLFCNTIQMTLLPALADARNTTSGSFFLIVERLVGAGGLVAANGLYSLAVLVMTECLRGRPGIRWPELATGYATFGFGMVLVAAGFINSTELAAGATGATIISFCLWTVVVAWSARPSETSA